jgi:hypothetical protein
MGRRHSLLAPQHLLDQHENMHLLHALRYLAGKGAAPLVYHLIACFSDLIKMERCSADVLLRWARSFLAPVEDLGILVTMICSYCAQREGQPLVSHPTPPRGSTPPSA